MLSLRASFSPAHPLARRDMPLALARAFCEVCGASWRTGGGRVRTYALREQPLFSFLSHYRC